jgi:Putative prokaryotic signal transducing protein
MGAEGPLACPRCSRAHPASERFCLACGMPLIQPGGEQPPGGELRAKARKIKPEYADGKLVKVASAEDLMQAEFIAGLLLEEGIPSVLRGSIAGYSPMMGGRDVLVPESGAQAAREALAYEKD